MSNVDGCTACHEIMKGKLTSNILAALVTAIVQELSGQLTRQMVNDGHMTKPFNLQSLQDSVLIP